MNEQGECCEVCGDSDCELFGYCSREGHWHWFCAAHRPARFYADKRVAASDEEAAYE
jgi:hypothetical protein